MSEDKDIQAGSDARPSISDAKGKAPRKVKAKPAIEGKSKRSLNLSLDYETYQRLALHALDLDTTISAIVTQLANTHLRRVHLTRTPTRED